MRAAIMSMCLLATASAAMADELTHVCNHRASVPKAVAIQRSTAVHVPGEVTFSVAFEEPTGTFSAWNDAVELTILAAAQEWSRFLDGAVNIELIVRFRDSADIGGAGVLATAAAADLFTVDDETTVWPGTILEILGFPDPNGAEPDANITINSDALSDFSFNLGGAIPGQTDLYTVVLHELGHILGFNGNTLFGFDGAWQSTFDLNVRRDVSGRFFFVGSNMVANFGGSVWLAADNTPHVGSETPSLMNPFISTGVRLSVGKLEFAMLSDSEMPIELFCWSEPSLIEADFDGDRTPDCIDECPVNPLLVSPGVCGCNTDDTDRDGDGVTDCFDECPDNPLLTSLGECGCNTDDIDRDGVMDCIDECPVNPLLTSLGECGCNTSDTDGDGTLDCLDQCPSDPSKITRGICGCGLSETDTDGDDTPDCFDSCPTDPDKTVPGECGCGVPDGTCAPFCGPGLPMMSMSMLVLFAVRCRRRLWLS